MASTATITGKTGAGLTMTAVVFNNVVDVDFNFNTQIVTVTQSDPNKITAVDISAATTITLTVSSGVYTLTIS